MLLIQKDDSPTSVHSVSSIVQHVVKQGAIWLIERRSVHSVGEDMALYAPVNLVAVSGLSPLTSGCSPATSSRVRPAGSGSSVVIANPRTAETPATARRPRRPM